MRSQATLVWAVIASFLYCAVCLPLGHVCLDQYADSWHSAAAYVAPGVMADHDPKQTPDQRNAVCQACLWSQTLYPSHITVELAVERTVTPSAILIHAPIRTLTDFFQSTAKRGPPLSSAI